MNVDLDGASVTVSYFYLMTIHIKPIFNTVSGIRAGEEIKFKYLWLVASFMFNILTH